MSDSERQGVVSTEPDLPSNRVEDAPAPERVFVGTGLFWGLIVGLVLALGVIVLAAQNTGAVTVSFLNWDFSTTLIAVILGALLVGIVLDALFGLVYRKRRRKALRDRDELKRLR